jgi:hypothetical protein
MQSISAHSRMHVATRCVALHLMLASSGCYLVHERPADAAVTVDAPRDAGLLECNRIAFGPSVLLEGTSGVTPRLVALDDGAVGVVYVVPGAGDPTEVWFERLDASLARVTGPVRLVRDASSWAQPSRGPTGVVVGFATSPRGSPSALVSSDLDGHGGTERTLVELQNPALLRASSSGLFWLGMEMHETNAFVLAHVAPDGRLLHDVRRIELGRYGSSFGVAARPDESGEVLAYPSEGPPGVRRARVSAIGSDGTLSAEHTLSTDGADAALPVFVGDALDVVYRTDTELRVARLDPASLDADEARALARLDGTLFAAPLGGRLVVGALGAGSVTALDATTPRAAPVQITTPLSGTSGALDWVAVPGGVILAAGLVSGPNAVPWIVRIECVP